MNILPNRIIGTVGEHRGFPIEALSLSHCGHWLASCSHDQLVKFCDVREVLAQKVNGHKRLRRTEQRKVLSSKVAAELDFFGDLDAGRGTSSKQAGDESSSEDDSSDSESDNAAEVKDDGNMSDKSHDTGSGVDAGTGTDSGDRDSEDEQVESSHSNNDDDDDDE